MTRAPDRVAPPVELPPVPGRASLYDSFAREPGGGNEAGVVLVDRLPDDADMQRIASALAAPTTGFVATRRSTDRAERYRTRFFTPDQEIDMCGHVVLALTTELVARTERRPAASAPFVFDTPAGDVRSWAGDDGVVVIGLRRPVVEPTLDVGLDELLDALEVGADAVDPALPLGVARAGLRHLFVPVRSAERLNRLAPRYDTLRLLGRRFGFDTFGVYTGTPVRLRDFTAPIGVDEEPASGTTVGALTALLAARGRSEPRRRLVLDVDQGDAIGRPSRIRARWHEDAGLTVEGVAARVWQSDPVRDSTGDPVTPPGKSPPSTLGAV